MKQVSYHTLDWPDEVLAEFLTYVLYSIQARRLLIEIYNINSASFM